MNKTAISKIEIKISQAMAKLIETNLGEYADKVVSEVLGDTIIVRFKVVFPPAEKQMVRNQSGSRMLMEAKAKLIQSIKPLMSQKIKDITGMEVIDIYSSLDFDQDERMEVFTLKGVLYNK